MPPLDSSGVPSRIDQLRHLTDAELESAIRRSSHSVAGGDILDEAARREAKRQTRTIIWLTLAIMVLTAVVAALTWVLLVRAT